MDICEKWRQEAMACLDGELAPEREQAFEQHLKECPTCARVFQQYRQMKEITREMKIPEPGEKVWKEFPGDVTERLSQGLGWVFYVGGLFLLIVYGLYEFIVCPAKAIPKIGVFAVLIGFLLLLFSIGKARYNEAKTDRYSKEVHR